MASYSKGSPYYTTNVSKGYLDIADFRTFPAEEDDVLWEVSSNYEHRPDLLAYDLYNDVNLWWVFAVRNPSVIKDPVYDLTPGKKIYIPKLQTLQSSLDL